MGFYERFRIWTLRCQSSKARKEARKEEREKRHRSTNAAKRLIAMGRPKGWIEYNLTSDSALEFAQVEVRRSVWKGIVFGILLGILVGWAIRAQKECKPRVGYGNSACECSCTEDWR